MSFRSSPLADSIAQRATSLIESEPTLSRDAVADRLLAEDGLAANETWSRQYSAIVSEVMLGERTAPPLPGGR